MNKIMYFKFPVYIISKGYRSMRNLNFEPKPTQNNKTILADSGKQWIVYDAKDQVFTQYTHEEFKQFINNRPDFSPIEFKDVRLPDATGKNKIWIDAIINKEYFK